MLPLLPILLASAVISAGVGLYKKQNSKNNHLLPLPDKSNNDSLPVLTQEKKINHNLAWSTTALALSTGKMIGFPILTLASIPIEIYLLFPFMKRGYQEIFKEKRLQTSALEAIYSVVMLAGGYFFAIALFFIFYNVSQKLLLKTQQKSHDSLVNILGDRQDFVWLLQEGVEIEVAIESIQKGDTIIAQAGGMIPVDGIILFGIASIDQHILTGEAHPVEKTTGDAVFAGTILLSGKLTIQVDSAGEETVAEKIGAILNNTADFKSDLETKGEQYSHQGVVPTLVLSAITLPFFGYTAATTILSASFGYNMRIVAPISILNALKITSKQGVLIKDGRALERLIDIDMVVFDKTGTLTEEQPHIGKIYTFSDLHDENQVLAFAACAEHKQSHPIAKAILEEAQKRQLALNVIINSHYEVGYGIKVSSENCCIRVGSLRFMKMENIIIPDNIEAVELNSHQQGYSLVYIAFNDKLIGIIELHPTLRSGIKEIIHQLHQYNLKTCIISGDNNQPTKHLAEQLGIDAYFAEVLPKGKADLITQLQQQGKTVCFIGDGINDAIALKQADVSISLGGASNIATDTAQIILMNQGLSDLPWLFEFSKKLEKNLQHSLSSTIIPGIICVMGVYLLHFGVIAGTILYNIGLVGGVSNAMLLERFSTKNSEEE